MTTTSEFWDWDGTPLNQPWWNVTSFGGSRQDLPLLRGQNYPVAFRSGQMWRSKQPDQRPITLAMWAVGVDQATGAPSSDQKLAFNSNFQQLRSMFWKQGNEGSQLGFLTRRWYITQSGSPTLVAATAQAEIAGTMQPTMAGRTRADFSVDFLLADPYFYGVQQVTDIAANGNAVITNLGDGAIGFGQASGQGGVAFTMKLSGGLTSPVSIVNNTNGVSCTVTSTIANGHSLLLDVLSYTAFTDAGVSLLGQVSHLGARPWMLLMPGANAISVTTGSGGDSGAVRFSYSPPYL